jgi:oxygen-independent coproporphyrinogen-3 oxidase
MDLIYGLPGQTVSSIDASVSLALAQAPARISLFGYAHVPWFRANQRRIDETKLPDAELRLALAETARERIEALGYVAVGIDHFARPDDALAEAVGKRTLRRNFQGYTTDQAQTLIGASSVGSLPQGYVQNSVDIATWSSAIDDHRFAVERGRELTAEDRLRAAVIADVLCFFDVDLAAVSKRFGYDASVFASNLAQLESLRTTDCVRIEGDRLRIVRDGPVLARIVASAFDTYLEAGARHSMAI